MAIQEKVMRKKTDPLKSVNIDYKDVKLLDRKSVV